MSLSPTPRRSPRASRLGLAVAALAATGTFAAAVAIAGIPAAPVADASASAPTITQLAADPTTGERVVLETVYIVTPALPAAAVPQQPRQGNDELDGDREHESEGGDD